MNHGKDVVEGMRRYYVQRAVYYERVYFKPERQNDLREMEAWLPEVFAGRDVLEIACGTGWWTVHGAIEARSWLATDINPETMAVARNKAVPASVKFAAVDAYSMTELAAQTFDAAFTGCWWSPVPLQRLPAGLDTLHARLRPGARVVMLDNSFVQTSSTPLTRTDEHGNTYQDRILDDGSVHEVLKNFPQPRDAIAMLGARVRKAEWLQWEHYWALSYELAGDGDGDGDGDA